MIPLLAVALAGKPGPGVQWWPFVSGAIALDRTHRGKRAGSTPGSVLVTGGLIAAGVVLHWSSQREHWASLSTLLEARADYRAMDRSALWAQAYTGSRSTLCSEWATGGFASLNPSPNLPPQTASGDGREVGVVGAGVGRRHHRQLDHPTRTGLASSKREGQARLPWF